MKRFLALFVAVAVSFSSTACTFSKMTQIQSDPAGAKVRIGGVEQGVTPASVKLGCSTFGVKSIELSKANFRTLKADLEYAWNTTNVVVSILFFWPGALIWGKCPQDVYNFKLDKGVADLQGKSTLLVTALDSPYPLYVAGEPIVPGQRLVLTPGWHPLSAKVDNEMKMAGQVKLEENVDHVVAFGTRPVAN
jgi:hypothetical protein